MGRKQFTENEKKTVYARCDGKCSICGKPVKFRKMTVDHIVPLSRGGTNEISNLQLACHSCNRLKNNFMEEEFYKMISRVYWHHRWEMIKKFFLSEIIESDQECREQRIDQ